MRAVAVPRGRPRRHLRPSCQRWLGRRDLRLPVYRLLPGPDVALGARVVEVFAGREEGDVVSSGFTYRTLAGHAFVGEGTFVVSTARATGEVRLALRPWSRLATPVGRVLLPLVRRLQLAGEISLSSAVPSFRRRRVVASRRGHGQPRGLAHGRSPCEVVSIRST